MIKGLVYNRASDKVYALGYYLSDSDQCIGDYDEAVQLIALFDIENPSERVSSYYFVTGGSTDLFKLPDGYLVAADNNAILYSGERGSSLFPYIFRYTISNGKLAEYAPLSAFNYTYTVSGSAAFIPKTSTVG
jgi:hypothetical protein